jgi:7-keto-8-aminopelargonate synthetase-like enzyme
MKLTDNLNLFASLIPARLGVTKIQSAIVPVIVGDETAALEAAQLLRINGCFVPAIRYPTVARGTARLRITLSAAHTRSQIATLASVLGKAGVSHRTV